jgi:hypothetical protein
MDKDITEYSIGKEEEIRLAFKKHGR